MYEMPLDPATHWGQSRDPVARTLLAYNYSRQSLQNRLVWQQAYRRGPVMAAGR